MRKDIQKQKLFQKKKLLKFLWLISIAIAFFIIINIIDNTSFYLATNNNVILASSAVDIPIPTPAGIDAGAVWDKFVELLKKIAPILLAMMFAIAAIMFIVSAGNPDAIRTAWKVIIFSFIGFLVIFFADWVVGLFR